MESIRRPMNSALSELKGPRRTKALWRVVVIGVLAAVRLSKCRVRVLKRCHILVWNTDDVDSRTKMSDLEKEKGQSSICSTKVSGNNHHLLSQDYSSTGQKLKRLISDHTSEYSGLTLDENYSVLCWKLRDEDLFRFSFNSFLQKLQQKLGSGATSSVYMAFADEKNNFEIINETDSVSFPVAIKVVEKGKLSRINQARNELQILSRLSNNVKNKSHFAALYFSFETKDHVFFGLEYCSGNNLHHLMAKSFVSSKRKGLSEEAFKDIEAGLGLEKIYMTDASKMSQRKRSVLNEREFGLDVSIASYLLEQLLSALGFLHEHCIIFRDIKPQNILLTSTGSIKLCDFGVAKIGVKGNVLSLRTKSFVGTVEYMSPEMITGSIQTEKMDVFQVGCVAYEMFFGFSPFNYTLLNGKENGSDPRLQNRIYKKIISGKISESINFKFNCADLLEFESILARNYLEKTQQMLLRNPEARPRVTDLVEHLSEKQIQHSQAALTELFKVNLNQLQKKSKERVGYKSCIGRLLRRLNIFCS